MRIAVSSRSFRRPLSSHDLTQLEWLERCASLLEVDGVLADVTDFPRTDAEYVAQLRKVAIDLGIVPFGIDAADALDPDGDASAREMLVELASGFGAAVIRTEAPAPGAVPPETFVRTVAAAKQLGRLAKAANVTVVLAEAPGTIAADLAEAKHLVKDTDSAWLRACPSWSALPHAGPKDRYPACVVAAGEDPTAVAAAARNAWAIVEHTAAEPGDPWADVGEAIRALRAADARLRTSV